MGGLTSQPWNRHQIHDMTDSARFAHISDVRYLISDICICLRYLISDICCLPGAFVYILMFEISEAWDFVWSSTGSEESAFHNMINFLGQAITTTLLHQSLSWPIYDSERQGPQYFATPCQSCFVSTYKGQCSTLWKLSACICFNSILRSMFRLRYCFDLPGIIQSNQNLKKGKWQRQGFNRF